MKRMLSFYHWKMPVYMIYILEKSGYNQDKFLDDVLKWPDLTELPNPANSRKNRLLVIMGYYVWLIYLTFGSIVLLFDFVVALIMILLGPFLVVGSIYIYEYFAHIARKLIRKNKNKKL